MAKIELNTRDFDELVGEKILYVITTSINTMTNNKTNEWIKWYWQGWDDFDRLDVPICPYEFGTQSHKQWWLGYTDAESEEEQ